MPTIRERLKQDGSRVFHVQVRMQGFPARTASFKTRREAERWAKTIEAEMIEGRHFRGSAARRRTVAEAIERYVTEELPRKADGSMHRTALTWWKERLGKLKLAEVTSAVLVECRGELLRKPYVRAKPGTKRSTLAEGEKPQTFKRSGATVNRYLSALSHVFTVCRKEWHWIQHNPFEGVSKYSESKGSVRFLSTDERTALLSQTAKDPTLHTFVVLALSTAARAGELLKLTWSDVDLSQGRLLFRRTKNGSGRTAWVTGEALSLLLAHAEATHLPSDPVFPGISGRGKYGYHEPFTAACTAAGVDNFRFHDLRHSAATYLAMVGATEQQLKAIGGWKSNVVSRYVHLAAEDAKDVLAKMNNQILGGAK